MAVSPRATRCVARWLVGPGGTSIPGRGRRHGAPGSERRQFTNTYDELSPEARELAQAIDAYKLMHRRRFITYEEMLGVVKGLGYGKGYQYSHDVEGKVADMDCLPDSLKGRTYFHPQDVGEEAELKQRLDGIKKKRSKNRS